MAYLTSSSLYIRTFIMTSAGDHITGITGLSPTVLLSKNGGTFAAAVGSVAEVGSGLYKVSLNSNDTAVYGDLAFHCLAANADPTDFIDQVVVFDQTNGASLGLSRLDANISSCLASASTAANWNILSIDANGRMDVGKFQGHLASTSALAIPNVDIAAWKQNTVFSTNINGVPVVDIRYLQGMVINSLNTGYIQSDVERWGNSVFSVNSSGIPKVDVVLWQGTSPNVLIANRVDANASAVAVTAGTVTDKTGYSLSQAFPTNFSSLSIDGNGRVLYANTVNLLKNTAFSNFPFFMVDSADHVSPRTSAVIAATRSLNGGSFGATANTAAEIANGWYQINLNATDLNANTVALRFVGTGCDVTNIGVVTNV